MCGLAVILGPQGRVSDARMASIFSSMQHRGPDDRGMYQSDDIVICHSRLAVEGSLEGGRQPIVSPDGRYVVIVNGELYPYRVLRQSLEERGYDFIGDCDSELALALYLRYGDAFVDHLRGEFVVVIWDAHTRKLLVVRDRFGIKPLVYSQSDGCWFFASEAKTLFASGCDSGWSLEGLANSFSFQYLLPGNSLFAGVKQLPPGHKLVVDGDLIAQTCYWSPQYAKAQDFSPSAAHAQIVDLLNSAVEMRMPRYHRSAFTLSSGLDCYCVSFDDDNYDEYSLANQFANDLGVKLNRVEVTRDDLVLGLSQAAYFSEGFASNGQYVGKYKLYQQIAADGYRVVMSGEGADEAFMGYAHRIHDQMVYPPLL
jgi:asparagine synthase (glutamine-hydrolysing)